MKKAVLALLVLVCGVYELPASSCYIPSYSYGYSYEYHRAGWWRGRWYPAGYYYWANGAWYLKGYGYHYGLSYDPYYYPKPVVIPVAAFQPVPVYFTTYAEGPRVAQGYTTPGYSSAPPVQGYATPPATRVAEPPKDNTAVILEAINKLGSRFEPLEKKVDSIDKRVEALEKKQQILPPPKDKPPDPPEEDPKQEAKSLGFKVMTAACASCHTEGKLAKLPKPTNFVMFTNMGERAELTKKQVDSIRKKIKANEMPPQPNSLNLPPLTEEDQKLVEADLPNWKIKE